MRYPVSDGRPTLSNSTPNIRVRHRSPPFATVLHRQGYLFKALIRAKLIRDRVSSLYTRCGRTDRGVSAFSQVSGRAGAKRGRLHAARAAHPVLAPSRPLLFPLPPQVVALTVRSKLPDGTAGTEGEFNYSGILNRLMPPNIRVIGWTPVDAAFNARFGCLQRTYKYFFERGNRDISVRARGDGAPANPCCGTDLHALARHTAHARGGAVVRGPARLSQLLPVGPQQGRRAKLYAAHLPLRDPARWPANVREAPEQQPCPRRRTRICRELTRARSVVDADWTRRGKCLWRSSPARPSCGTRFGA